MSRHRDIRNLNIQGLKDNMSASPKIRRNISTDELDDDAFSDQEEEQLTEEQQGLDNSAILETVQAEYAQAQMNDGLEQIRQVIGSADFSGLSDQSIKDQLWEYYFNVDKTMQWAMDEMERRRIAKEKKEETSEPDDQDDQEYTEQEYAQTRLPSIFRAQQQPDFDQEAYQWVDPTPDVPQTTKYRLSTISEKSERTEPSTMWQSRRMYTSNRQSFVTETGTFSQGTPRNPIASLPSSPTTSYGRELDSRDSIQDLSILARHHDVKPEPSNASTVTPDDIEESHEPLVERPVSVISQNSEKRPASKLSKLANSRASTASMVSHSSRSSGVALTGSVKTFPALRPSVQSMKPPSSVASSSDVSKSLPPLPYTPTTSEPSEIDSLVRKAIASALQHETIDMQGTPTEGSEQSDRSITPVQIQSRVNESPVSPQQSRPQSKLALLAQKKLESAHTRTPPPPSTHLSETVPSIASRPPSKLAILAQQKIDASRMPKLPRTTTEYLTPIANGASVTTAITTSYQSLYSITDPNSPSFLPKLDVVPIQLPSADSSSPIDVKRSKLAMKVKRGDTQPPMNSNVLSADEISGFASPLFHPSNRARASPSAFASVLINDNMILCEGQGNGVDRQDEAPKAKKKKNKAQKTPGVLSDHEHGSPIKAKKKKKANPATPSRSQGQPTFAFDIPSPDDIVLNARKGTKLGAVAAKDREKALKAASATNARNATPVSSPLKAGKKGKVSGSSTPLRSNTGDQQSLDMSALNLTEAVPTAVVEERPKITMAREKIIEEARRQLSSENGSDKKGISMIVIGHVDAGKSTLMGRLLYELGRIDDKTRKANERGSDKLGKGSFSWAWGLDGTAEERERGITMDIALQSMATPHRQITILDAPGHKDFVPNMISGASQADSALLVVDASTGEFEAGFQKGGQTREHLLLVRSLGVTQVVIAVNKLDQVSWSRARFEEICEELRPFLVQSGFHPSKSKFVPVGAFHGVNLVSSNGKEAADLREWYKGPTLADLLDKLEPPTRDVVTGLRVPVSNVFRGQGSSLSISGRICGGIVQVGEKLRVLPGDETTLVKSIEIEEESVPWAMSGANVTLALTSIDPVNVLVGSVLCPPSDPVPLATIFTARIIVFDIQVPITAGTTFELFHHSRDVPASALKLLSTLDRATGQVTKTNPRVLTKGTSAEIQIGLRGSQIGSSSATHVRPIPLETFANNKDMGRILIRRGGETIAAGVVLTIQA